MIWMVQEIIVEVKPDLTKYWSANCLKDTAAREELLQDTCNSLSPILLLRPESKLFRSQSIAPTGRLNCRSHLTVPPPISLAMQTATTCTEIGAIVNCPVARSIAMGQ
jgi:hypothetical protein